jgi:hypothetical protein
MPQFSLYHDFTFVGHRKTRNGVSKLCGFAFENGVDGAILEPVPFEAFFQRVFSKGGWLADFGVNSGLDRI